MSLAVRPASNVDGPVAAPADAQWPPAEISARGASHTKTCASGPSASGTRAPKRRMAIGRPKRSATSSGLSPGETSKKVCSSGCSATGKRVRRIFEIDHPRHEPTRQGQFEFFLGDVDGNRKATFLPDRWIEPVDDFDGRKDFKPFVEGNIRHFQPIDRADQHAGSERCRRAAA